MFKLRTLYWLFVVAVSPMLLHKNLAQAQGCGAVTASDIIVNGATCPGNGKITVPGLASSTVYQLSGGNISGEIQQNSPVFESLSAGTYTLKLLCTGEPVTTISVTVPDQHSPLSLNLAGTMLCSGSGTISATASGGFNAGGVGVVYQYTMWPASAGGANRLDSELSYGPSSTFGGGGLGEGLYYVRVKDNCGNIFTQGIDLKPSRPTAAAALGDPILICSGGSFSIAGFQNAALVRASGAGAISGDPYSIPYYQYRVERLSASGNCETATVTSVITPNTAITSAGTLASINVPGVAPGDRIRVVVISPCGSVETSTCLTVQEAIELEARASRICAPTGGSNVRLSAYFFSVNGYTFQYPVSYTFTGAGGYSHTVTATDAIQISQIQTNVPESAFPVTITATDGCGLTKTVVRDAPSSGPAPSPLYFDYDLGCVQDDGNVNIYTYPEDNWFGLEYNTGADVDKVRFELVDASTSIVASTVYGLNYQANNQVIFRDVPAGASYFVRVTPPASAGSCAPQNSNIIVVPTSEGLQFNVSPVVEKVCNTGLNNIIFNASINSSNPLEYRLYAGTDETGTLVSQSATAIDLAAGTYYYKVVRLTSSSCPAEVNRTGIVTVDAWQTDPTISRSLSVNCQPLGSGPQNTGSALLQFSGFGPFRVERSINGGAFTEVASAAVSSYAESSLSSGSTYRYRVVDQCGKSVSQQVMIKPLSPRLVNNTMEPCEAQPYTLSAIDFGDPLTVYTWEKVGTSGVLSNSREYTIPNFTAADNGSYKLTVSLLNGCVVRETILTLNSANCGNPFATGSLGNLVWFDTNSNGLQDTGEAGVPGAPVTLQGYVGPASPSATDLTNTANWADVETMVTDGNGNYLFDGLESGYYRVRFATIQDYGFTSVNTGADPAVDSDAGPSGYSGAVYIDAQGVGIAKDNPTVDAGLVPAGSIGDFVWVDDNQNGKQDADEDPMSGVTVHLYIKNALGGWDLQETMQTDAAGKYLFGGLLAGVYQVEFVLPANYEFTYANVTTVADTEDSDANQTSGKSPEITIDPSQPSSSILRNNMTIDAGMVLGSLPVKLAMFEVKKGENMSAALRWMTSEELNSSRFEIQRSNDAKNWNTIGQVGARRESQSLVSYRFDDQQPLLGQSYYRLKMVDQDETFAFSSVRSFLGEDDQTTTMLYPNPASHELSVLSKDKDIKTLQVISQAGKTVLTRSYSDGAIQLLDIKALPAGAYVVKITYHDGTVENRKITVIR